MLTLSDKCYRAEFVLGMTTDTQDADGEVLTECEVTCSEDEIRQAIMSFVGEIEQIPPMYSAIKQNGKKLYELARKGIEVERKSRKVTINSIDILEINGERVTIDVSCSKGTYIRTLCEDIGMKLHVGAYMNTLRRTKTGPFTIEESHTLKEIETLKNNGELEKIIIPVDRMFEEYPKIKLNPKQVKSVTNGVQTVSYTHLEKGISQEVLIDALEAALVAAYKKNFYSAQNVEVSIDRESGTVKVFAKKEVVDLVYDEFEEISLEDARAINGNYQIGDMVNIEVTPKDFGRISAMTAKQVVTQLSLIHIYSRLCFQNRF